MESVRFFTGFPPAKSKGGAVVFRAKPSAVTPENFPAFAFCYGPATRKECVNYAQALRHVYPIIQDRRKTHA